jgi:hypothetical protein
MAAEPIVTTRSSWTRRILTELPERERAAFMPPAGKPSAD